MITIPPTTVAKSTTARQTSLYVYQVLNYAQSEILDICIFAAPRQKLYHTTMSVMIISFLFPVNFSVQNNLHWVK